MSDLVFLSILAGFCIATGGLAVLCQRLMPIPPSPQPESKP